MLHPWSIITDQISFSFRVFFLFIKPFWYQLQPSSQVEFLTTVSGPKWVMCEITERSFSSETGLLTFYKKDHRVLRLNCERLLIVWGPKIDNTGILLQSPSFIKQNVICGLTKNNRVVRVEFFVWKRIP